MGRTGVTREHWWPAHFPHSLGATTPIPLPQVVPWDHDIAAERDWYDALFISNGPGDPARCG